MTVTVGSRLGPYEILSPLGAGGMGEVYRARDTRLSREVAIKVLPAEVAADPGRLKRFEKEARAASALNHPSIVTIYEIGCADSVSYIAMELVAGATLRELLAEGPLPVKKLLQIAAQVTDGLAKAHEAGIVHRDLKPENVMVTKDGFAKLLDFGLAKLTQPEEEGSRPTEAPTVSLVTEPGVVMGTVGYMSPEQARGRAVDFRSDQFSFGSVLYEIATGKRAFAGESKPEILSAIIREEPEPIGAVNPKVPAPLRWIVERCLAKEPKERYASTEDLARDLSTLRDRLSEATTTSGAVLAIDERPRRLRLAASLAILALIAALAAVFSLGKRAAARSIPSFQPLTFRRGLIPGARFSPDGQSVVYGAAWEGKPIELFSVQPPSPESRPLGPAASILAISSNGEMALSMGCRYRLSSLHSCIGTLARASLSGGAPRELLEKVSQADWSPDGRELAVVRQIEGGHALEFPIGRVLRKSSGWIGQPRMSPRGDALAFFERLPNSTTGSVAVVDIRTGKVRSLSSGWQHCTGIAWPTVGDEVWFTGIRATDPHAGAIYAVTTSGGLRTVQRVAGTLRLHDIARDGRVLMTLDSIRAGLNGFFPGDVAERDYSWFGFSIAKDLTPDGRFLLFAEQAGSRGAYFRRTDGSPAISLGNVSALTLSPDAKWIATFVPGAGELPRLTLLPTGPGEPRTLPNSGLDNYEGAYWFPDGGRVSIEAQEKGRRWRCYEQAIDGGEAKPLTPEGTHGCLVSPDGRLLAAEDDQGRKLVFPLGGGEVRTVPAARPDDGLLQWTSDSAGLFLRRPGMPVQIERLDLAGGRRVSWKELSPSDPAGILGINEVVLTPGGRFYAYSVRRVLSELYVVEGLR